MGNEFMLAISQCQVDLIDLRRIVRERNIILTQMRTRVKIQESKLQKMWTVTTKDELEVDTDDEDEESTLLANDILRTNTEISELQASFMNDSWTKIFEMMKMKLEEDVKDNANEEELAKILRDVEQLTGTGNGNLKLSLDVDIKLKLEADIRLVMTEIAHLKEGINIKKAEIQANTTKIAQDKDQSGSSQTGWRRHQNQRNCETEFQSS